MPELDETTPPPFLKTRTLGRTKIQVTELMLGTWGLAEGAYGPVERSVFGATVEAAVRAGIRAFDMAPSWGDGLSEQVVAEAVGTRRNECAFVTRVGVFREDGSVTLRFDPKSIMMGCHQSLARLGTDFIDLLLLHDPPEKVLQLEDWAKALAQLQGQKLIGTWGVTCTTADQARMALARGAEVVSMPYNFLWSDELDDLAADLEQANAGVLARSTLMHGLLAGRYEPGHRFAPSDHRHARWAPETLDRRLGHVQALRFVVQHDVSSIRAGALRYALSNPQVSSVALGPKSPEQLEQLVSDAGQPPYLVPEVRERVPQVLAAVGAV